MISILRILGLFLAISLWVSLSFAEKSTFRIGAIYGLSGAGAGLGESFRKSALLAVEEINKSSDVSVELIVEDSRWDNKTAVSAFKKLVDIDKVKIVHVLGSAVCLSLKPLAERRRIALFCAAAHPNVTKDSSFVIRHANLSSSDAEVLAQAVSRTLPVRISCLYRQDDWGVVFDREFKKRLSRLVPDVQIRSEPHFVDALDLRPQLMRLIGFKPQAIVIASFGGPAGLAVKQLKELGYRGFMFANNGIVLSEESFAVLEEINPEKLFYQTYAEPPEEFRDFHKRRYHKEPGLMDLYPYTDMELIFSAFKEKGEDPAAIVSYVKALGVFKGRFEQIDIDASGDIAVPTIVRPWQKKRNCVIE